MRLPAPPSSWPFRTTTFVGAQCSGKSTLATHVANILGLPVVNLDGLRWSDGWHKVDNQVFVSALANELDSHDRCIVEGSTIRCASSLLPRLGLFVFLDLRLPVLLWRALRRSLTRIWTRQVLWHGNRETWRQFLNPRTSLLVKLVSHFAGFRAFVAQALQPLPHVRLRSSREVRQWLADNHFPPLTKFEALP